MPVPRQTWEPRTTVKAAYQSQHFAKLVQTDCTVTTSRPTVNLDNFPILDIQCDAHQVAVHFNSSATALDVLYAWRGTRNLTVMFGYEWRCTGSLTHQTHIRSVRALRLSRHSPAALVLSTAPIAYHHLVTDIEINLQQYPRRHAKRSLTHWATHPHALHVPLDINFANTTGAVTAARVPVYTSPLVSVWCVDCHTRGHAEIDLHVKGTLARLRYYRLRLRGDVKANLDAELAVQHQGPPRVLSTRLATLPMTPVGVPGLFDIGPQVFLDAAVSLAVERKVEVSAGFDVEYPFDVTVESPPAGETGGAPRVTVDRAVKRPAVNLHPVKTTRGVQVQAGVHLVPGLAVGVTLLSAVTFDLEVQLDNELGVQVTAGNYSRCPEKQVGLEVYHQHGVQVSVKATPLFHKSWTPWTTGRLPLSCPFCNMCLPLLSPPGNLTG
ncbi:hypothetical protein RI367_007284 [Sorochytrium milnesiophthora]